MLKHATLMFVVGALIVTADRVAASDATCKPVVGSFEARIVPHPDQGGDCLSVFCTEGRVWGGLQATYRFTMPAPPIPSGAGAVQFFTGTSDITMKSGEHVIGADTGSLDFGPSGGFASLITFFSGATGQIRLRGQLDPVEGTTSGDYIGTICTP